MTAHFRIKCPHCGKIINIHANANSCPECKKTFMLPSEGKIYLYRQGSPYGVAGGFGVFINSIPFGYIGNKELLCIPVPYGTYTLHSAVGMSRKCEDLQVTVSPNCPNVYTKVYIRPGFWANSFVIEPMDPALLELQ